MDKYAYGFGSLEAVIRNAIIDLEHKHDPLEVAASLRSKLAQAVARLEGGDMPAEEAAAHKKSVKIQQAVATPEEECGSHEA